MADEVTESEYSLVGTRISFSQSENERQVHAASARPRSSASAKSLAILTSGGDAPGMNAAVRAAVRMALFNGMKVYAIKEGYQGMVDGVANFEELKWSGVSNIIQKGGTVIGSARCKAFMEREGRLKAAENLVKLGINNLVVIGGDGSLTGANIFKEEWKDLVKELVESGRVTEEQAEGCSYLNVVGLVGTIDNDMCGTDMTIGADSALHRIIEAIDCITSTAASHQRSFVLEVMGRNCGYLAQMAAIAGAADWVLIPECPPKLGWESSMCKRIDICRLMGKRFTLVIISEGAVDSNNKPITSQYVKEVLEKQLKHDTRITVLGHVQRGGKPSAYDRIIGCRMGAAAGLLLAMADEETPPKMVGVQGNQILEVPLMDCINATRRIGKALNEHNFSLVIGLKGPKLVEDLDILAKVESGRLTQVENYRFGVMHVGSPAGGMNSCVRALVRLMLYHGHTVVGINEGFDGLLEGNVQEMTWEDVSGWQSVGGANLGSNTKAIDQKRIPEIASKLHSCHLHGLVIIGGFEAYWSLVNLAAHRNSYTEFQIPLLGIPATAINNVPGTQYSLGCDTAMNAIVASCDTLKQSATSSRKQVCIVEVSGDHCGYLATMAGLAGGADAAYIFEDPPTVADMQKDVWYLVDKCKHGLTRGLVLRNQVSGKRYDMEFMTRLYGGEGKGVFHTRSCVLGALQQGDNPSPFDRILGVKYAAQAVKYMMEQTEKALNCHGQVRTDSPESACMLGIYGNTFKATPLVDLVVETDFEHSIPKYQWWMSLRPLLSVLAKHRDIVSNQGE